MKFHLKEKKPSFLLFITIKQKAAHIFSEMGIMTQSVLHFLSGCKKMTFIAHLRLCLFRVMGHSLVSGNKLHYIPLHIDGLFLHKARELKKKKKEKRSVSFKMCFIKKDIKGKELVSLLKWYVLY